MKGQYLAVESVLTFGLGIIAAVGIIGVFSSYSSNVFSTAEQVDVKVVQNDIKNNLNSLDVINGTAHKDLELPDTVANSDYTVSLSDDEIALEARGEIYRSRLPISEPATGSGSGDVRIYKTEQGYELTER